MCYPVLLFSNCSFHSAIARHHSLTNGDSALEDVAEVLKFYVEHQLIPPPNEDSRARLMWYVLKGNSTKGLTIDRRLTMGQDAQRKYVARRVCHSLHGSYGVVLSIYPMRDPKKGKHKHLVFPTSVMWDATEGKKQCISQADTEYLDLMARSVSEIADK